MVSRQGPGLCFCHETILFLGPRLIHHCFAVTQSAHADRVDQYIHSQMELHRIPGLTLEIIQNGKVIKTAAYGLANVELKVPAEAGDGFRDRLGHQAVYRGGHFAAGGGEWKPSLEDKISKDPRDTPEAWTNVTIRHLLTHSSGIKNYTGLNGSSYGDT